MPLGPVWLRRRGLAPGVDAALEILAPLRVWAVPTQPVVGPRQFPGRVEVTCIRGQRGTPDLGGAPRAGKVGAISVENVRVGRLGRESGDIE